VTARRVHAEGHAAAPENPAPRTALSIGKALRAVTSFLSYDDLIEGLLQGDSGTTTKAAEQNYRNEIGAFIVTDLVAETGRESLAVGLGVIGLLASGVATDAEAECDRSAVSIEPGVVGIDPVYAVS
jgi:hypothetical protein